MNMINHTAKTLSSNQMSLLGLATNATEKRPNTKPLAARSVSMGGSECLSKKLLIITSPTLLSEEMPDPSCILVLDEKNAIKMSTTFY